jgi:hypothetical protein
MTAAAWLATVAASIAVLSTLGRIGREVRRARPRAVRSGRAPDVLEPLRRLERAVEGAGWSSALHLGLRPILREVATAALSRHAIDPAREPARAADLLGAELWALVGPGRRPFEDGLDRARLAALVARLEELLCTD